MHDSPNKVIDINELERQFDLSISLRPKRNGETKVCALYIGSDKCAIFINATLTTFNSHSRNQ